MPNRFSLPIAQSWRPFMLWIAALASVAAVIASAYSLVEARRANTSILGLLDRQDVAIDAKRAADQEVLARVNELIRRDRIDEAQALLGSSATRLPADVRAAVLFNLANARTRAASEFVRKGDMDSAAALINLAKSEYRLALKLTPEDWNARFNIDVAMRIVRDLPLGVNPDQENPNAPKRIWTDLPGVPKGLP